MPTPSGPSPVQQQASRQRVLDAGELRALIAEATHLATPVAGAEPDSDIIVFARKRLKQSVLRPWAIALTRFPDAGADANGSTTDAQTSADDSFDDRLWALAQRATGSLVQAPEEHLEATAALQACAFHIAQQHDENEAQRRIDVLRDLMAELPRVIKTAHNGPYLATNVQNMCDYLGERLTTLPQMALCRCGASESKPFCDGSHAGNGFTDTKSDSRVPDKRDTYVGQQVTIFDNRGICQHSGFCTDRLASVFHAGQEPFVAPSGGRMDEIIRAVRDCPSGALSFALDGVEARDLVDHGNKRPPTVEITKDGPYRVSGGIPLTDGADQDVSRATGSSREHYALCRCGQSQNKPFCSGMHWYVGFQDPVPDAEKEPSIFEWAGGLPAFTRMTRIFYEKYVPADPLLSGLFSNMSADHPERVAKWLSEVFCGPHAYSSEYGGYPRMLSQHMGKQLREEQRARWVQLIMQSALDAGLPNDAEFRSAFGAYIEWGSRLAVENSQTDSKPPQHMPMPHWDWRTSAGAPSSRISALADRDETKKEPEVELPGPDVALSFASHIKHLFRDRDRASMTFVFDLWKFEDVDTHADAILERLANGSMPCDGAWAQEKIDVFKRWIDSGKPA
ncbi:MAG TPA: CDGSH iron-sulfur domain-containing protein [Pseudonocardiaceae bacterium]|jgi:CDGSH-type Zn-finger protein